MALNRRLDFSIKTPAVDNELKMKSIKKNRKTSPFSIVKRLLALKDNKFT